MMHHLYIALGVHHPKSSLLPFLKKEIFKIERNTELNVVFESLGLIFVS